MVDFGIIRRKILFINDSLEKLKILKQFPKTDFLSSFQVLDSCKYNLQLAIEAIIDISSHIVAREKLGVPSISADTVRFLNEKGILDENITKSTLQMINFRNRIVHLYQEVNDEQIYDILQSGLEDIEEFIRQIEKNVLI